MNASTVERLNSLNRDFYCSQAAAFDEKRRRPWPGWERVAALLADTERPSILDLGCGNGRFGGYIQRQLDRRVDYVGVDASPQLLRIAAAKSPEQWRWIEADFVLEALPEAVGGPFDLVVCFGVMHHVPGEATRQALLEAAAAHVAPGGHLVVSFWQFGDRERFRERALSASDVEEYPRDLAPEMLEENDFLLPWGADSASQTGSRALRYCHWADAGEVDRLVGSLGLDRVAGFHADGQGGDLNLYRVLRR